MKQNNKYSDGENDEEYVSDSSEVDPKINSDSSSDSENKPGQTLLLLYEIAKQVKDFSEEKIIDYEQIADTSEVLGDGFKSKEIYDDFRNKLRKSTRWSEIEKDWKKSISESFPEEAQQTFPDRVKIYNNKSGNILEKEEKFTHKIIDSYIKLTNPSEDTNQLDEFSNLWNITDGFLEYIKKEEQGNNILSSPDRRNEFESVDKAVGHSPSPRLTENASRPPFNPELYKDLK